MSEIKGHKAAKSSRYDYVTLWTEPGFVVVSALDGYFRERAAARLDVKAARKLMVALGAAIAEAEAPAVAAGALLTPKGGKG